MTYGMGGSTGTTIVIWAIRLVDSALAPNRARHTGLIVHPQTDLHSKRFANRHGHFARPTGPTGADRFQTLLERTPSQTSGTHWPRVYLHDSVTATGRLAVACRRFHLTFRKRLSFS